MNRHQLNSIGNSNSFMNSNITIKKNSLNNTTNANNTNTLYNGNLSNVDPDEQFVLDVIRTTKQESIQNLVDMLRLQESKSILLIRILERYKTQLDNKDLLK